MNEFEYLFRPSCVAVIGATDRERSVGRALVENLTDDFEGDIVPITPDHDTVLGHECYPELGAVSASIDVAVVAIPPAEAVDAVRDASEAGIEDIIIITSGFAEAETDGTTRQEQLRTLAEEYDLNLVGPNCLGVISTRNGLNATFAPGGASPGPISFMSQSGAFISAVLDWAADTEIGFVDIVSLGNEAVLDGVDFLEEWRDEPETSVILAYLEDIKSGREFIDVARDVTQETPLVVLQAGQSQAGTEAASSHTGALSGSAAIANAGLDQAGAIRAENAAELLDFAQVFVDQPVPESGDVGIVTNAGGPGVLGTDSINESRLSLASITDRMQSTLTKLSADINIQNPLDIEGDADTERFRETLDAFLDDSDVDAAIVIASPTGVLDFDDLAPAIAELRAAHDKPLVTCLMGGQLTEQASHYLAEQGIPTYFDPARAVRSLAALVQYSDVQQRDYHAPTDFPVDEERAREVLTETEDRESNHLDVEAMELIDAYGIPVPDGGVAEDPSDAEEIARNIDGPVVLKVISPDIVHKSEAGGVHVGVGNEEVAGAFEEITTQVRETKSDATISGVLVQEMVDTDVGQETIIGMDRDPQFGPALLFGFGGLYVEVFEDTTFRVAPVSEDEARRMTEEIETAPLLRGARGRESVNIESLVETIQRVSQLVMDFPAIDELDINPLVALPDGVCAVDLSVTVDTDEL